MKRKSSRRLEFGGPWTTIKLDRFESYLPAYTKIFTTNPGAKHFRTIYLDAFAGTGRISYLPDEQESLFEGSRDEYVVGSAARALAVVPEFDRYVFIESNPKRFEELQALKESFPRKKDRIEVRNEDANSFLLQWCKDTDWKRWRAVVLLDPFAMNVAWDAVAALGGTAGVDLWWLFPCGAFNRLLTRGKKPPLAWANALTRICGTPEWEERFYRTERVESLFGPLDVARKVSGFDEINSFLRERLQTAFAGVVNRSLYLANSKNTPIFMLFFASSNPKGAIPAVKIANWIIEHGGD
jgi:three-Cys-motif partner protein